MSPLPTLCLNMIVKSEAANLERCLSAVAPHVGSWSICDTGSTDGTPELIEAFFAARGLPGELHRFDFINFEQARNRALALARTSSLDFDYLLLVDADMELVVDDPQFREHLTGPCYDLLQRAGISYWNRRIVRRDAAARYHGVTHEYLDVEGACERLSGAWFIDHASGSNRTDKFRRDIRLLRQGLKAEPEDRRYWFYLAQSLRDAGRMAEAAKTYAKRAEMGGWDEEAWHARLSRARCLKALGDEAGFVREALAAYEQRPHRAEPLYDLARFHRERGDNNLAALYAEAGLALPYPAHDSLFVEDFVYQAGLREELAITAYYSSDPKRRARGLVLCDGLALDRDAPEPQRLLARQNLRFYARPAGELMPSFTPHRIEFAPPAGWSAMNPSIARSGDRLVVALRIVNYVLAGGVYHVGEGEVIQTRNMLLGLGEDLAIQSAAEILGPIDLPSPKFGAVRGFEDPRLIPWCGELWCTATVRELTVEGWCQQMLARIDERPDSSPRLSDWRVIGSPTPTRHEKNWMPILSDQRLAFLYGCDPTRIVNEHGATIQETTPAIAADAFRGGSQVIAFDGGWLALVHEVAGDVRNRVYSHRFIELDAAGALRRVTAPFYFNKPGTEFAAGLTSASDGEQLLISYGVDDREALIATLEAREVRELLRGKFSISIA